MRDLKAYIDSIRILDNHEHIRTQRMRQESGFDFYQMLHYIGSDLVTAGMPWEFLYGGGTELDPEQKAQQFLTYWRRSSNTGYARALNMAVRDLYGMQEWTVPALLETNEKVRRATQDPGWYSYVLRERAGIDMALTLIQETNVDLELFRPVLYFDPFFRLLNWTDIETVVGPNRSIGTLGQYMEAVEEIIAGWVPLQVVASKMGHAYWRTLFTEDVSRSDAEAVFRRLMDRAEGLSQAESKPLQDYLIHFCIQQSVRNGLPIQIHTGHHEPSVTRDGNTLTNSLVSDLIPLLLKYRDARFVLLHGGYPYVGEYASIAKNFPNVYADMTWLYVISPTASKQLLHQLIDMVPQSKILGFGGDYLHVEGAYAHSKLARSVLTSVLQEKLADGSMNEEEAAHFADLVLRDNVNELYDLSLK
ncbi:amidohydrolase family protein [Paenibacillus silvisoli]|uniref:amidohydrolase family protein n=1 Tax=Paenibacillus silvisoli TaxID=3110539 RepID=UPI002804818B|nr:amidohydrolase family protein [Paenibacillus silvisoli]